MKHTQDALADALNSIRQAGLTFKAEKSPAQMLAELQGNLVKATGDFKAMAENALAEANKAGTLSTEAKAGIDKATTELNAIRVAQNEILTRLGDAEQLYARLPDGGQSQAKTVGEIVASAQNVLDFAARKEGGQRAAVPVDIRAALTSFGVQPSNPATRIIELSTPRLNIRDLIAPGQTGSNAIFYIRETGYTNASAAVAENTVKPYSELTFEEVTQSVKTIAHMFKASKQILDDLPQMISFINGRLMTGLKTIEDAQLLFGSGVGANLHGIFTQATAYAAPIAVAGATNIDTLRLAMLQAELADLPATGHVLHRSDWAKIQLTKDAESRYLFADPMGMTMPMMWGLPVAEVNHAAMLGKFLTGSFSQAAQIYDREDANVIISTENADDFERNMITMRCEERLALAVYRPQAFIKGTFA